MRRVGLFACVLLCLPLAARGASTVPSIVSVTGEVKIGHDGTFRMAAPNDSMEEKDFLVLAQGATVIVTTAAGGQPVTFSGKATIPCRRLLDPKATPDVLMRFSVMLQKASEAIGGAEKKSSIAGATKAGTPPPQVAWAGEERKLAVQTGAELDQLVDAGSYEVAERLARALIDDRNATLLEKRQARVCLGDALLASGDASGALSAYEVAAADPAKSEGDVAELRARALVGGGYLRLQRGEDADARRAFEEAIRIAPTKSHPSGEAHLFLGLMAGASGDREQMAQELNRVGEHEDLQKLAVQLKGG